MLFQRKIERAQQWLKERSGTSEPAAQSRCGESDLPSPEELREEGRQEIHLEKGDLPAMMVAALITILPVCLVVLLVIVLIAAIGFLL